MPIVLDGTEGVSTPSIKYSNPLVVSIGEDEVAQFEANGDLAITGEFIELSSVLYKENISEITHVLPTLVKIRGVKYNKIGKKRREVGLIAEEVALAAPELVSYNREGEPVGVKYTKLVAYLVEAVKQLSKEIEELKNSGSG